MLRIASVLRWPLLIRLSACACLTADGSGIGRSCAGPPPPPSGWGSSDPRRYHRWPGPAQPHGATDTAFPRQADTGRWRTDGWTGSWWL